MKKRWIVLFVGVAIVAAVVLMLRGGKEVPTYESVAVGRGTVSNTVSVTGYIEPLHRLTLAFSTGGRLVSLPVAEGGAVLQGAPVALLDDRVLESSFIEAETRVHLERARLRELIAPLRTEERAVKDAVVVNAERALERAVTTAHKAVASVYVYAHDAVYEEVDELFVNPQTSPRFGVNYLVGTTNYVLRADNAARVVLNVQRSMVGDALVRMEMRTHEMGEDAPAVLTATDNDLVILENFLTALADVVNRYTPDDASEQVVYEVFQTSIASARTSIHTARTEVVTAQKEYDAAEAALMLALRDMDLSLSGAAGDTVLTQEAAVQVSIASARTAQERMNDTVLVAPIAGTVTKVEHEVGEVVSPNEAVVELLTVGAYEVEAFIPEADIARLKLGDKAMITFDAFERTDIFSAEVVRIALSETIRDGVPTYKTTLILLDNPREGLTFRPGMTADIDVITDVREDVLYIPSRSVVREGGRTFVRIFDGNEFQEAAVEVGLRGSEGTSEVQSGLTEGQEIVLFIEEL